MIKKKYVRKTMKGFVSLLLVLAVMAGLFVPFDISVFAEEEPARGSEIHAILYYINPDKKTNGFIDITYNLELIFQRGSEEDPTKTVFKHFTDFADNSSIPGGYVNPWYCEDTSNTNSTNYHGNIMVVDIKDKIAPKYMNGWFMYLNNLTTENFKHIENLDTSECIKMNMLFNYDSGFTSLDLSAWTFPALKEASSVFSRCRNLTSLDISSWDMPNCFYIPGMFSDCEKLETIDISHFNMEKPRYFSGLFSGCKSLKNVNLGTLVFPYETQLSTLFKNCSSLEEVDLSGWTVKKPGIFKEMFSGCTSLRSVDFGPADHWGTTANYWSYNGNREQAYGSMFENCKSLESLDLTCVHGALICSSMFKGCSSLKEVDLSYAGYETAAADIPFRVDVEGIHYIKKNNKEEAVSEIKMINTPPYQVIYHTNLPTGTDEVFKTVDSPDLVENKVTAFSGIPTFSDDKYYSFMGWYTQASGGDKVTFDRTYTQTTHLYAHWHAYKLIFHANNPNDPADDVFRTFTPSNNELNVRDGITHFYDIPSFAGDEYVFAGWYHSESYLKDTELEDAGESIDIPADFEKDAYLKKEAGASDPDYHLYAKWIEVGTVSQQTTGEDPDTNDYGSTTLRGFGLAGVQIRKPQMKDSNYGNVETPAGMRFVTSLKEELLKEINDVSDKQVTTDSGEKVNVEYGYVVGTEDNINAFKTQYKFGNDYRIRYCGENVNGVNTTGAQRSASTDYRYIKNINCTSNMKIQYTYSNGQGTVAEDHRNFGEYRLYTLVVTYEGDSADKTGDSLDARAYIRYYDANGKLRVFYNDYRNSEGTTYYGGCMCSYDQVL